MSVEIAGAVKRFGEQAAVDGVDIAIAAGEFFVVLGPSGCGKSTLLRLVAGLEPLDAGEIRLGERLVSGRGHHTPPEARRVGVVFQSYALWPHMSVRDNVAFPAEAAGRPRRAARKAADAHLATVDLAAFADRRPAALSGGQRQRVALARCLAGGAEVVLMDEPLANLDPHLRGRMEHELARFHRAAGVTTLYITHDQREAMALADRIAVMGDGRFLQVAPPEAIHDRPASADVARFIGRAAVLPARLETSADGPVARLGPVTIPVRVPQAVAAGPAEVVVRPGDVALGEGPLAGRLEAAFYRGGGFEALARVEGLAEPVPVASPRPLRDGQAVPLAILGGWVLPPANGTL